MSIMAQLEFQLDFSQSEKALSQYILENGNAVLNMNSKELAKNTYTSPATIVRLCQKLGLKGYSDFKIKYSAELKTASKSDKRINVNFPFTKDDNFETISHNIQKLYNEAIEDTLLLMSSTEMDCIVDILYKSKSIYLYGSGDSLLAAMDFEHRMARIGKMVNLTMMNGQQFVSAYNTDKDDVAIILSYTGETPDLLAVARILKYQKVPVVVITSVGKNSLAEYGDYIIRTCSRENMVHKIASFSSKLSMEYIMNLLFARLFQKDFDDNLHNKLELQEHFDPRKPNNPIRQ